MTISNISLSRRYEQNNFQTDFAYLDVATLFVSTL